MRTTATHPPKDECPAFFQRYLDRVDEEDVLDALEREIERTRSLLEGLSDREANHCYQPGKWSIKDIVGHLTDIERIFGYRALRFARNDATRLSGYEHVGYVANAGFGARSLDALLRDFEHVRRTTLDLFSSMDDVAWGRRGLASGEVMSVRSIPYFLLGHERHHMGVIRKRYL